MALPILLFGAGGLAADIIDIVRRIGGLTIAGCVVDRDSAQPPPADLPVHRWSDICGQADRHAAVNAIGSPARRGFIEKAEAAGFEFLTLVDPSAQIFPSAAIGGGSIVGAGCVIAAAVRVGRHVFLNRAVTVGHHASIGEFASCHAAVNIGGFSRIGPGVEMGIGSIVIDRITVGANAVLGAGCVVIRDCAPGARLVGVPGRPLKSDQA